MRKTYILLIFAFFLIYTIWSLFFQTTPLEVIDLKILDTFFKIKGQETIDADVIVVAIDEYSLSELEILGDVWPWERDVYGDVISNLFEDGAKAVAFDVSFTEPSTEENDLYFSSMLLIYKNVVLGTYLINEKETYVNYNEKLRAKIEENLSYLDYAYKMRTFQKVALMNPFSAYKIRPVYELFAYTVPSATYEVGALDVDGVVRKLPLMIVEEWSHENGVSSGILPHMNVIATALFLGVDPQELIIDFGNRSVFIGTRGVPFDKNGYMSLWYYGKSEKIFKEIPFFKVLRGDFEPGTFKDKVVLVGYTATAKGLYDLRITPFSNNEAGVYVHATAIENMIRGNFLKRTSFLQNGILYLVLIFSATVLITRQSKHSNVMILLLPVAYGILSLMLFLTHRLFISTFYPSFSILFIGVLKTSYDFYKESAEKRKMKEFLYRYVPDRVADELVKSGQIQLGGEIREVVVLFSDIKGFTSMSEKMSAQEVVKFLNEYLTRMSEIIRYKYDGTIDKFIGDAIMAIFGAPVRSDDFIEKALRCSLEMRKELRKLNAEIGTNLDSGIGIHYGPAVVGNIGAPFRMDYTCIGDTVNTASRIEHLTRDIDAEIIVSQTVYEKVKDGRFKFEYIGEYKVKGKDEPLRLYRLLEFVETVEEVNKIEDTGRNS